MDVLPVIHIGFLDFTLHPEKPEFYATYKMLNVKNHLLYSDKFALSVVNLKEIELATTEDKAYKIDYWARLFKAKTWEEIKMFVKENEYLQEAAENLYVANADEIVRQQCRARADAERLQRTLERDNKILKEQNADLLQKHDALVQKSVQDAIDIARNLFKQGASYEMVKNSIEALNEDELKRIYKEVKN